MLVDTRLSPEVFPSMREGVEHSVIPPHLVLPSGPGATRERNLREAPLFIVGGGHGRIQLRSGWPQSHSGFTVWGLGHIPSEQLTGPSGAQHPSVGSLMEFLNVFYAPSLPRPTPGSASPLK
jgi:hypothetical protein